MVNMVKSFLPDLEKNQPRQTYVHQLPYAINRQHITKHLELSGMDEILKLIAL